MSYGMDTAPPLPGPNPSRNDPISRWLGIISGQIKPTPDEARQLAILQRAGGAPVQAIGNATGITGAANALGGALGGLGQGIGSYISDVQNAGQQAFNQAQGVTPYGPGNSYQESPYPVSQSPDAVTSRTGQIGPTTLAGGGSGGAEQQYAQAYEAANSGSAYPDETRRSLALNNARYGPTSAANPNPSPSLIAAGSDGGGAGSFTGGGGSAVNTDAARAAQDPYAAAYAQAAGGGGAGGPGFYDRQISQQYEEDPEAWVDDLFAGRGMDTSRNRFARGWRDDWAKSMPLLLDFYVMSQGGDPFAPEARAKALQTFGPEVITGRIHPAQVINGALQQAQQNPEIMAALVEMGPEAVMGARVLASGQSRRVANARNTVTRRQIGAQRRADIERAKRGEEVNDENSINIALGRR